MSANDNGLSTNKEQNITDPTYDVMNPISNDSIGIIDDGSNKRRAQLGQWRTPPQPFFPNITTSSKISVNNNVDSNSNGNTNTNSSLSANSNMNSSVGGENNVSMNIADPLHMASIPPGVDPQDYAALQEAYRRGAEAAAALAHPSHPQHAIAQQALFAAGFAAAQQHQQLKSNLNQQNVSSIINTNMQQVPSPDNQQQLNSDTKHIYPSLMAATASSLQPTMNPSHTLQQQQQVTQAPSMLSPNSTVNMNPNIVSNSLRDQQQQQKQSSIPMMTMPVNTPTLVTSSSIVPPTNTNSNNSTNDMRAINNINMNSNIQGNTAHTSASTNSNMASPPGVQAGTAVNNSSRSISLPDMARFAARATAEEQKRKKRLARNRASARLRRLKKKNLVDTYEGEVGVLEFSLSKLKQHTWGTDNDHEALLEALSMDRGQQPLTPEIRKELICDILKQQREQVQNIVDVNFELMLLGWLARQTENVDQENNNGQGENNKEEKNAHDDIIEKNAETEEEENLSKELNDLLRLTPEQKSKLRKATENSQEEYKAIQTVDKCLEAMLNNNWIMNHHVEECTQQFISILNPGQMSKFLLWTDHNAEAIDQLDYVNAPSSSSLPAQSPTFVFGTDNESVHGDAVDDGDEIKDQ